MEPASLEGLDPAALLTVPSLDAVITSRHLAQIASELRRSFGAEASRVALHLHHLAATHYSRSRLKIGHLWVTDDSGQLLAPLHSELLRQARTTTWDGHVRTTDGTTVAIEHLSPERYAETVGRTDELSDAVCTELFRTVPHVLSRTLHRWAHTAELPEDQRVWLVLDLYPELGTVRT